MSAFQIKAIAIVCMIIDHLGVFLFPQIFWLRLVGRIAFPLFAWLIANGAHYTHDMRSYLKRLFIFALISQIPFTLATQQISGPTIFYLNIFFTLFLGLSAIYVIKTQSNKWLWLISTLAAAGIADLVQSDYGAAGVLSIVAFYLFFENIWYMAVAQMLIMGALPWLTLYILQQTFYLPLEYMYLTSSFEYFGLLALVFIFFYNKKPGWKDGHLLYAFYPLQFIVFFLLKVV
ncbi:MAG: hypothetical protein KGJ35_00185 [Patescibacteria group bacterium]|nr:hypothetical protein [Patescibacteria group bacterium]